MTNETAYRINEEVRDRITAAFGWTKLKTGWYQVGDKVWAPSSTAFATQPQAASLVIAEIEQRGWVMWLYHQKQDDGGYGYACDVETPAEFPSWSEHSFWHALCLAFLAAVEAHS